MTDKKFSRLTQSKVFCMAPWIHIHMWPNGAVYPCCMANNEAVMGNYKETPSLIKIWNSNEYSALRQSLLSDQEIPSVCSRCYEQELTGRQSPRHSMNRLYGHLYDAVVTDSPVTESIPLAYIDIRFSNICNLTCRTCGPQLSSAWNKEWLTEHNNSSPAVIRIEKVRDSTELWDDISQHLAMLERIYFAGGEPLLMKEHYDLLDYLIANKMTDIEIFYSTNMSVTKFKQSSIFDYWSQFSNIRVNGSLDDSYRRGEYLRKGLVWDEAISNRSEMKQQCPDVAFILAMTISIFNAEHVLDFYQEWVDLGLVHQFDADFNVLIGPSYYRIENLPAENKRRITDKIDYYLSKVSEYRVQNPEQHMARDFQNGLISFRTALAQEPPDKLHQQQEFLKITAKLDSQRNESVWEIFPELSSLKDVA